MIKEIPIPETAEEFYFGARLRLARKGSGLSIGELAQKMNLSHTSIISAVETGNMKPSARLVRGYEQALGLKEGTLEQDFCPIDKNQEVDKGAGGNYYGKGVFKRPVSEQAQTSGLKPSLTGLSSHIDQSLESLAYQSKRGGVKILPSGAKIIYETRPTDKNEYPVVTMIEGEGQVVCVYDGPHPEFFYDEVQEIPWEVANNPLYPIDAIIVGHQKVLGFKQAGQIRDQLRFHQERVKGIFSSRKKDKDKIPVEETLNEIFPTSGHGTHIDLFGCDPRKEVGKSIMRAFGCSDTVEELRKRPEYNRHPNTDEDIRRYSIQLPTFIPIVRLEFYEQWWEDSILGDRYLCDLSLVIGPIADRKIATSPDLPPKVEGTYKQRHRPLPVTG